MEPVKTLVPTAGGLTEVFKSPDGSLQAQIDRIVAQLQPGTGSAVFALKTDEGAKLGVVFKTRSEWSFGGFLEHAWKGKFDPQVSFKIVKEFR